MQNFILRGVKDTLSHAGGWPSLLFGAVGAIATLGIRAYRDGLASVAADLPSILYALAGLVAGFILFLVYNIAASPFRIELDRRKIAEGKLAEFESSPAAAPDLRVKISNLIHGGEMADLPGQTLLFFEVTISNIGTMPTAAHVDGWRCLFNIGGVEHQLPLQIMNCDVTMAGKHGLATTVQQSDAIYKQMERPVAIGEIAKGFWISILPRELMASVSNGDVLKLSLTDALGAIWSAEHVWAGTQGVAMHYLPFAKVFELRDNH